MIKPSDFAPLIAHPALAPAATSVRSAGASAASSAASWFDAAAVSGDTRIGADLDLASRGLSVGEHADRVLAHLCGAREDSA